MSIKPVHIFGFIMSFAYVFFGLLFMMTSLAAEIIIDEKTRKITGAILMAYGLFRVSFFLRKIIKKNEQN